MNSETHFNAPWGALLKTITLLSGALLIAVSVYGQWYFAQRGDAVLQMALLLPVMLLIGAALFTVRGYRLVGDDLRVQRLAWDTVIPLRGLQSAAVDPQAMHKSLRTFGNGGLFSFSGRFYSKKLGAYRAYASDPKHAVVLKFENHTVVVTPGRPDDFVAQLKPFTGFEVEKNR